MSLLALPNHLLFEVAGHLCFAQVGQLSCTCKALDLVDCQEFWKDCYFRRLPVHPVPKWTNDDGNWKSLFCCLWVTQEMCQSLFMEAQETAALMRDVKQRVDALGKGLNDLYASSDDSSDSWSDGLSEDSSDMAF